MIIVFTKLTMIIHEEYIFISDKLHISELLLSCREQENNKYNSS